MNVLRIFLLMCRGFSQDVKLILKLMLHIYTYNKTNMMLKKPYFITLYLLEVSCFYVDILT